LGHLIKPGRSLHDIANSPGGIIGGLLGMLVLWPVLAMFLGLL